MAAIHTLRFHHVMNQLLARDIHSLWRAVMHQLEQQHPKCCACGLPADTPFPDYIPFCSQYCSDHTSACLSCDNLFFNSYSDFCSERCRELDNITYDSYNSYNYGEDALNPELLDFMIERSLYSIECGTFITSY